MRKSTRSFRASSWVCSVVYCGLVLNMTIALAVAQQSTSTVLSVNGDTPVTVADFRVDTDMFFKSNNPKPDKQMLTLFKEGVYYDFPMDDPSQSVTMIDPQRGRIVMLNSQRQLKTVFQTAQLLADIESLKKNIVHRDLAKMLTAAQQVTFAEDKQVLRVGDENLAYEATLQTAGDPAKAQSMAVQYADFADWSARLNTVLPPNFPPFVRLELNRQIAGRGVLPDTISRLTRRDGHTVVVKSKLLVIAGLSNDDQTKIRTVGEMLHACKEVGRSEFFVNQSALLNPNTAPGSVRK